MNRGGRGSSRGGSFRGNSRGGGGGRPMQRNNDNFTPDYVEPVGTFMHLAEGEMIAKSITHDNMVPFFNAIIYLEDKKPIGKIDEIFGGINDVHFSIKPMAPGMNFSSFKPGMEVYVSSDKLLPLSRFLPKPVDNNPAPKKKRAARGANSGSVGGFGGKPATRGFGGGGRGGSSRGGGAPRGARGGFGGGGRGFSR